MPRSLRIQQAKRVSHVICKGNANQPIFTSEKDYHYYLNLLKEARQKFPIKIYNFVLVNNHLNLLIEPLEEGALSKAMEYVSKSYAKYFNQTYHRTGHLFEGRFKSFLVEEEKYFFACSRYIDITPIRSKIVFDPKDYEWAGYGQLSAGKRGPFEVDFHELYTNLGKTPHERQISYRALILNYQGEDLDLMNRRQGILGTRDFKKSIKEGMLQHGT